MKVIAIAASVLTLAGCETMRTVAPQTVAGFEANGVLGAIDGATGAILTRCRTLDGREIRIAFDGLADTAASDIEQIRAERQKACAVVNAVAIFGAGLALPAEPAQLTSHASVAGHPAED